MSDIEKSIAECCKQLKLSANFAGQAFEQKGDTPQEYLLNLLKVELTRWFDLQFPPLEKYQTYAMPGRRQGSTPDIPRPRYIMQDQDLESRTFGVVVDTSGSISTKQL